RTVTGVQTCALPIWADAARGSNARASRRNPRITGPPSPGDGQLTGGAGRRAGRRPPSAGDRMQTALVGLLAPLGVALTCDARHRSEERRVGKGCRAG